MDKDCEVFKDFIDLADLLLNLLYALLSLLNDSLIEDNLIIQKKHLLSVPVK